MLHCLNVEKTRSFSIAVKLKHEFRRTKSSEGLVDILCYCLMSNHIHLLVKENVTGGISKYMQKLLNGYAKFFNMSQERAGSLFTNPFRAVLINGDDQLLHVSRYIHLNPYAAHMTDNVFGYRWSSLAEYVDRVEQPACHTKLIHSLLKPKEYKKFVADEADHARSIADIKHLLLEEGL